MAETTMALPASESCKAERELCAAILKKHSQGGGRSAPGGGFFRWSMPGHLHDLSFAGGGWQDVRPRNRLRCPAGAGERRCGGLRRVGVQPDACHAACGHHPFSCFAARCAALSDGCGWRRALPRRPRT